MMMTPRAASFGVVSVLVASAIVACASRPAAEPVAVAEIAPAASTSALPPPKPATPAMRDELAPRLKNEDIETLTEQVDPNPAATTTDPMADAVRVVASLRRKFKACYNRALNTDPTLHGKVMITANIAPDGTVTSATSGPTPMPKPLTDCLERVVMSAQFTPPGGKGTAINIPINFKQPDPDAGP